VGAKIANTLLDDPKQKASALIEAADANDLLKEGVDKASVLARYASVLGMDVAQPIVSNLADELQTAIDAVQPFIEKAGGLLPNTPTAPIGPPGTLAKINFNAARIRNSVNPRNAPIIVQRFQEAGFGPSQQTAALAAAIHESRLNERSAHPDPDTHGNPGIAYGLFQCRQPGVGDGHSPAELRTADGNISAMIGFINKPANKSHREQFVNAADVQSAIQTFVSKFEQPADVPGEVADRVGIAQSIMDIGTSITT
jgi:Phage tail lysozyme